MKTKKLVCYNCDGKCELCVWKYNGGCSEWNGWKRGAGEDG